MYFETGDVMPFDTHTHWWRSPSPAGYVSTIHDEDENRQSIDDQDKSEKVSDYEMNKMPQ